MKIRVASYRSVPAEIRQVDGRWVIFDKLILLDTDGCLYESLPGETTFHPIELPERQKRTRANRK